jgi:hypothetical protein
MPLGGKAIVHFKAGTRDDRSVINVPGRCSTNKSGATLCRKSLEQSLSPAKRSIHVGDNKLEKVTKIKTRVDHHSAHVKGSQTTCSRRSGSRPSSDNSKHTPITEVRANQHPGKIKQVRPKRANQGRNDKPQVSIEGAAADRSDETSTKYIHCDSDGPSIHEPTKCSAQQNANGKEQSDSTNEVLESQVSASGSNSMNWKFADEFDVTIQESNDLFEWFMEVDNQVSAQRELEYIPLCSPRDRAESIDIDDQ